MSGESPYGSSYPSPQYAPGPPAQQNGLGTAALVLGIIALVLFWTVFVGIICGVLAIIFGAIGRGRARSGAASNHGAATAGLVTGSIAVVLTVGLIVLAATHHFCAHYGTGTNSCTNQQ